ncbi:hypothetical protein YC2023_011970 [Brassica napus]
MQLTKKASKIGPKTRNLPSHRNTWKQTLPKDEYKAEATKVLTAINTNNTFEKKKLLENPPPLGLTMLQNLHQHSKTKRTDKTSSTAKPNTKKAHVNYLGGKKAKPIDMKISKLISEAAAQLNMFSDDERRIRAASPEIVEREGRKRRNSRERRESSAERNGEEDLVRPNKMTRPTENVRRNFLGIIKYFRWNFLGNH